MCSCKKLMMLEVGEPGELPLLTSLKKTQKSPLHKSIRSNADSPQTPSLQLDEAAKPLEEHNDKACSQEYVKPLEEHNNTAYCQEYVDDGSTRDKSQRRLQGRNAPCKPPKSYEFDRSTLRTLPMDRFDMKVSNWHAASGTSPGWGGGPADCMQRESLRNYLEKLGIVGESSVQKSQAARETTLLRHWPIPEHVGTYIGHASHKPKKPSSQTWDWLERSHNPHMAKSDLHHPQNNHIETSVKVAKQAKADRLCMDNDNTLSPLVLNPRDDANHSFGQENQSSFTLDVEHGQYSCDDEGYDHHLSEHQQQQKCKTTSRARSALPPKIHKNFLTSSHVVGKSIQSYGMYTSPPMSHSQGIRSGCTSETKFLEYDLDALDLPSTSFKGSSTNGHPRQQLRFLPSRPPKHSEVEPLPLLTELKDYIASDLEASSIAHAGDHDGNLSMRGLQDMEGPAQLQLARTDCKELVSYDYRPRNLSQKYRPKVFEELVGQPIVTQALSNAILKGRIAPVYLFHGSHGTGKTSAARIFASCLTCISPEAQGVPGISRWACGACRECMRVSTGKSSEVREVDAASHNGIEQVKALLEETISAPCMSRHKVFIIDECHVLTMDTWNALLKILEEPPMNVVIILITTDPDQLPRTATSRCQKFPFPKIKHDEIVQRLMKLVRIENLVIGLDILQLIASQSNGSLRDAETTLDQVALLGEKINASTLHELVGSTSDEKLLGLLDSALLADTISTVRRARDLVDSGVDPLSLMSRLATLITDILAGSFMFTDKQRKGFFWSQTLSKEKLQQLRMAMKILSDAEKQLRVSNDRATWLTGALLQLGPERMYAVSASCVATSVTQSPVDLMIQDGKSGHSNDGTAYTHGSPFWGEDTNILNSGSLHQDGKSGHSNDGTAYTHGSPFWGEDTTLERPTQGRKAMIQDGKSGHSNDGTAYTHGSPFWGEDTTLERPTQGRVSLKQAFMEEEFSPAPSQGSEPSCLKEDDLLGICAAKEQRLSPNKLDDIWHIVMEKCRAHPLRQLLATGVKLSSIEITEVDATVHLEVSHLTQKSSCERSHRSIANLLKVVLGFPVEITTSLASLPAQGKHSSTESSRNRDCCEPQDHTDIHPERLASEPHIPQLSQRPRTFPAIQHRAHSHKNQHLDSLSSYAHSLQSRGQAGGKGQNASEVGTPPMPASGASPACRAHTQLQNKAARDSCIGMPNEDYYNINQEYLDGEEIVNEIKMASPCSLGSAGFQGKNRLRHEGSESTHSHAVDEFRSSDTKLKQGERFKLLQSLSIRNCRQ